MPFQKGRAKTGGIQTGGHHKVTSDIRALLDGLGCNPVEGLARIAMDEANPVEVRRRAFADVARYIHPQLQSVAVSGPDGGPVQTESANPRELLFERIEELRRRREALETSARE